MSMRTHVPDVSVLMTVHNGARYLEPAARSVLAQTGVSFELVIVDDGSTDQTPAILSRLSRQDDRVRVIQMEHAGIPRAANAGLAACRAGVVARCDADDLLKPGRLAQQLAFLRHSDAVCVGTFVDFIDERGRFLTTIACPTDDRAIQEALLRGDCSIWHTSAMIRRDALERVRGYDERFDCALDLDLWLRLGEVGRLANMPVALQCYRLHADSVSETRRTRQRERCGLACERAYARRGLDRTYVDPGHWRPGRDAASRFEYTLRYGWWAYQNRQRTTAMSYGLRAIRHVPFSKRGWTLLAKALLQPAAAPSTAS